MTTWGIVVSSAAFADTRIALVVGNSNYANTLPLANPQHDADDVSKALTNAGFQVMLVENATKRQLDQSMEEFSRRAVKSDAALIYFAGHGMQCEGHNYVMPVDAQLRDQFSLAYEMTKVDDVKNALAFSPAVKILILDSCRDNPLSEKFMRSIASVSRDGFVPRGLAPAQPTQGMAIVYATQSGQPALDGGDRNSPFAMAFIEELSRPGQEIAALFRNVEHKVVAATGGRQSPELSISGVPDYLMTAKPADDLAWDEVKNATEAEPFVSFLTRYPNSPHSPAATARIAYFTSAARSNADSLEGLYWQSAAKFDTVPAYQDYLKHYPGGAFSTLALHRIAGLTLKSDEKPTGQKGDASSPGAASPASTPTAEPASTASRAPPTKGQSEGKAARKPPTDIRQGLAVQPRPKAPPAVVPLRLKSTASKAPAHKAADTTDENASPHTEPRPARQRERKESNPDAFATDIAPPAVGDVDNYGHARCAPGYVRIRAGGDWATSWQGVQK